MTATAVASFSEHFPLRLHTLSIHELLVKDACVPGWTMARARGHLHASLPSDSITCHLSKEQLECPRFVVHFFSPHPHQIIMRFPRETLIFGRRFAADLRVLGAVLMLATCASTISLKAPSRSQHQQQAHELLTGFAFLHWLLLLFLEQQKRNKILRSMSKVSSNPPNRKDEKKPFFSLRRRQVEIMMSRKVDFIAAVEILAGVGDG